MNNTSFTVVITSDLSAAQYFNYHKVTLIVTTITTSTDVTILPHVEFPVFEAV
jgi:hypothetical protein